MRKKKNNGFKHFFPKIKAGQMSEMFFAVGVGSFLTFGLLGANKSKIGELSKSMEALIQMGDTRSLKAEFFEVILLAVGLMTIFLAPFIGQWTREMSIKFSILWLLLIIDMACFVVIIVRGELTALATGVIWLSLAYISWLGIEVLKAIYRWLIIDKGKENQFDVAKLTFIWVIIAFVLGKII